ncbi:cysteinyl-tRNA synthetase [Anaplasma centrale str. Israel]|uniref:Cysteine--tRNA ligase n=1 Tax=Anaplasma centrale (strain Israel) TaxID=574556 RepID=D1ASA6_ANACI|nr:cysteine--tRNA ligase [Anaplasma centrale]ACZ49359.1 cysteinyl-tRNA synthetase [Anaplasma centrale str. Israel]
MRLHDTLRASKRVFSPRDGKRVGVYVCGPTVYDLAHIGNARSVVVYDVLFRLLKALYPEVVYVRNITDVDDKIINAANSEGKSIAELTAHYTKLFHEDIKELNCLPPTFEPKATEEIETMLFIIGKLIETGHAYVRGGTVYFSVESYEHYGALSGRKLCDMISGSRVEVVAEKLHPGDFVLWKPATDLDMKLGACWSSPWGVGRPGWHVECSAMSYRYLGESFDIHGGGADLMFPHHENELSQSCCAFHGSEYARYWVHNGFLTVNGGEKMSKSLGNVITVRGLLNSGVDGEVVRYAFLSTHYRKPLDWGDKLVLDAKEALNKIYRSCEGFPAKLLNTGLEYVDVHDGVMSSLQDDINTPGAIAALHELVKEINKASDSDEKLRLAKMLNKSAMLMGLFHNFPERKFSSIQNLVNEDEIERLIAKRIEAKKCGDFKLADEIRKNLSSMGIGVSDGKDGSTRWHRKTD